MEIGTLIAIIGCALSIGTFFLGRLSVSKNEGKEAGSLSTNLIYIKESVKRIEDRLESDVGRLDSSINASILRIEQQHDSDIGRLDGRIDEISTQLSGANTMAARALEAAKSAHKRQDEHLERDHGKDIVKKEF